MYRLARQQDLIRLKMEGPGDLVHPRHHWGLKHMGYLFVVDRFWGPIVAPTKEDEDLNHASDGKVSTRILEVGAGLSLVFYPLAENRAEYWIADKAGFYDERRYEEARRSRSKAKMVDSLMGENNPELPDSYFDLVFSVSVLEHIPKDALSSAVADMHRILKPNGLFLHSLDLKRGKEAFEAEFRAQVERVGFEWLEPPQPIDFTVDGLLFEPLDIVFEYYDKREEMQYKLRAVGAHTGTVLVGARKRSTSDPGSIDPAIAGSAESGSAKIDFWRRLFRRGS